MDRAGLFEQANGGTLLLDEINSMPYDLQSKLLRVLQEDYIRRVGGSRDIPIDVYRNMRCSVFVIIIIRAMFVNWKILLCSRSLWQTGNTC